MSGIWSGNTRCVVNLTFDFDGTSGMRFRDPKVVDHPSQLSLGEFGPKVGVFRILDLLAKYQIKSSFFVPGYIAERNEAAVERMIADGHEVGHHGYLHEPPATLERDQEEEIIERGISILKGITGQPPVGYRSPSWDLSPNSLELLAGHGFRYDSSMMGDDAPYFVETPKGRLVELPVQWVLDDVPYYAFNRGAGAMASPQEVFNAWQWEFDGAYEYGRQFMLTMHPYVSGRLAKIMVLEKLIRYIMGHLGVEFSRCVDVADDWSARFGGEA